MTASVKLSVTAGPGAGRDWVFDERTTCIAGRAQDCQARIVEEKLPMRISRHHCLFDVNPPDLRVRDFGSLNGTHVNGEEIGRRRPDQTPEEGSRLEFRERDLVDGDEVRIGDAILRVSVSVPRDPTTAVRPTGPPRCSHCGSDVSAEVGLRRGDFLCAACRRDPGAIVDDVLNGAPGSDRGLRAIQGYALVRELGRGTQSVVYLARQERTGEMCALKVLLAEVAVEQSARNGFLREIESTRALRHENVVAFRDSGSSGATFFLASEYCDGGSVERLMAERGGTLGPEEAVDIVSQVLDGLDYAHGAEIPGRPEDGIPVSHGLVHRDIKPRNILLSTTASGRVAKLADFGLAKAFDRAGLSGHTRAGAQAGTFVFMARQQLVDYKYAKPEVDVWAVAATLYYMLTCALARDFRAGADQIEVILCEDAIPIRDRDRSIPRKLAAVIDEALIDYPQITIKTARELQRALLDAL